MVIENVERSTKKGLTARPVPFLCRSWNAACLSRRLLVCAVYKSSLEWARRSPDAPYVSRICQRREGRRNVGAEQESAGRLVRFAEQRLRKLLGQLIATRLQKSLRARE